MLGINSQTSKCLKSKIASLDYLVGPCQHVRRNRQSDLLRSFQVDHELKLGWLLYWQVGWLRAFQNFIYVRSGTAEHVGIVWPIGHESPESIRPLSPSIVARRLFDASSTIRFR